MRATTAAMLPLQGLMNGAGGGVVSPLCRNCAVTR